MPPTSSPTASWGELLSGRNGLRAIALTGGVALHAINVHVVTTILPSVVRDIGGLDYYAWNTTLFIIGSILGAVLVARMLSTLGPRATYLWALALFALGTAVCALAPDMVWMLAGRSTQGLGGGMLAGLGYALIRIVFEERLWARAVALVSGMWGVATLCGPALGGVFAQAGHWRLAFWALLPCVLALGALVAVQLSGRQAAPQGGPPRLPLAQVALLIASVMAISLGGLSTQLAWNAAGVALSLALAALVVHIDRRAPARLLPSGGYSLATGLGVVYACIALLLIATTTEIFVPYFLQLIHGYQPLAAGYLTAAMAGGWSIASLFSSGRSARSAQGFERGGPVLLMAALLALAWLMPQAALGGPALRTTVLALVLAAVGFGVGIGWPHLLTRVMTLAPAGEENIASTAITTVQLYGMAVGSAVAGLVAHAAGLSSPGGVPGAQQAAVWLFGSFALAPALALWIAQRAPRRAGAGQAVA